MTGRKAYNLGLFLAAFAAFALGVGHPHIAQAAEEVGPAAFESLMNTPEGKAALTRAGLSDAKLKTMLAALSSEQQKALAEAAAGLLPRARLTAQLKAEGYNDTEIGDRLAVLTDQEIAELARDPEAMTSGTGVGTIVFLLALVLVAVLVAWYFVAIEEPEIDDTPKTAE